MVIGWLGHPGADIRRNAADLLEVVGRRYSKPVLASFVRRLGDTKPVSLEFLKMPIELLIDWNHPRDQPLTGLQAQPSSAELSAIRGYFGDPTAATKTLHHCSGLLQDHAQFCERLPKFFDQFQALKDANFEACSMARNSARSARLPGSRIPPVPGQLLEILLRRQGLVEHDLLIELTFGACEVLSLHRTLGQLEKFNLLPRNIDKMQACVSELLVKSLSHYALSQKVLPKAIKLAESLTEKICTASLRLDDEKVTPFLSDLEVYQDAAF
jgi:hypothetical protein